MFYVTTAFQPGDSGGIVMSQSTSTTQTVIGLISGVNTTLNYGIASKASNVSGSLYPR